MDSKVFTEVRGFEYVARFMFSHPKSECCRNTLMPERLIRRHENIIRLASKKALGLVDMRLDDDTLYFIPLGGAVKSV